jgi:hypothetical protein
MKTHKEFPLAQYGILAQLPLDDKHALISFRILEIEGDAKAWKASAELNLVLWLGKRATVGRTPPQGFRLDNKF